GRYWWPRACATHSRLASASWRLVSVSSSHFLCEVPGQIEDLPVEPVEDCRNVGILLQLFLPGVVFVPRDLADFGEDARRRRQFRHAGLVERGVAGLVAHLLTLDLVEQAVVDTPDALRPRQCCGCGDRPAFPGGAIRQRARLEPAGG